MLTQSQALTLPPVYNTNSTNGVGDTVVSGQPAITSIGRPLVSQVGVAQKTFDAVDFPKKIALVFGSESKGIRNITSSLCDEILKININKEIESLNVSNSAAISFYYLNKKNSN